MKKKYIYLFKRLLYFIYGEKFYKRLNYDWKIYPSRTEIIKKLINYKNYKTYLEIGCDQDENFSKINLLDKIGVDPKSGGTHRMTSDVFFNSNKKKFDFIYIDGLHTYEQAVNDIKNSLNFLNENGIILLHDCLPKKIWNQIVPRIYGHWNGDVWKAIVESRTWENTNTITVIADHGLGLIQKKKNLNILKDEIRDFKKLKYRDYYEKHTSYMNPVQHQDLIKLI
tara:strand:+ start:1307 stop:1981 length:675 start_codon:yes stop_codon:yes gene_type:complete